MTTDAARARRLAEAVAGSLQQARPALGVARERLDSIGALLQNCARDLTKLTDRALDIASTSRPEQERDPDGDRTDPLGVRRDEYLGAARKLAEGLKTQVLEGQRSLLGRLTEDDPVPTTAHDELSAAASAIEDAANALDQLEQIDGYDAKVTGVLRARVDLLRDAVGMSRSAITTAATKLDNARLDLDWLMRDQTLSAADEPLWLASQVSRAGIQAGAELGKAKDRLANADGRLDTVVDPADLAATESAQLVMDVATNTATDIGTARVRTAEAKGRLDAAQPAEAAPAGSAALAAHAGLNPTPTGDQRPVVSSSARTGAHNGGTARGVPEHGK